jgi:hypothetical protein
MTGVSCIPLWYVVREHVTFNERRNSFIEGSIYSRGYSTCPRSVDQLRARREHGGEVSALVGLWMQTESKQLYITRRKEPCHSTNS